MRLISFLIKALKIFGLVVAVFVIGFMCLVAYPIGYIALHDQQANTIIISNINVIDVEDDSILMHHHVLIENGKITDISLNPFSLPDQEVLEINGSNKYLISGMWDMHTHFIRQAPHVAYPEFVRHGVTHARDMKGAFDSRDPFSGVQERLDSWNTSVKSGELIGPELHGFASFPLDGANPMLDGYPEHFKCRTAEDAVRLSVHFKQAGVSLIKIYNNIPHEAFFAIMDEAKERGIAVAGHKPIRVSAIEASDAGMKSMEHARFFIRESFQGAEDFRSASDPFSLYDTQMRKRMLKQHDTLMLVEIFEAFVRNGTWYCPTHLTRKQDAFADDSLFRSSYDKINPILRFLSFEDLDATLQEDPTPEARKVYKDFYQKGLEITADASDYGVKILAGSDVPELPGSSLHDELIELASSGLDPFEVLRTATLYPAEYYDLSDRYGSVKKGKVADLVLLSKNPVLDIHNIGSVEGVMCQGKFLDAEFLNEVRNQVAERRTGVVMTSKLIWDILIFMTL